MDRLFANGTVNAADMGNGPALFLFHSLLSDRASFDAVAPELARTFRVIVPELPGFGKSSAVDGGIAEVADRMAQAVRDAAAGEDAIVLGNGYGGFVALQLAIRHPQIAARLVLADCGAAFSQAGREAFRSFTRIDLAQPNPPAWSYVLLDDHPTVLQRIAMIEAWRSRYRTLRLADRSRAGS